MVTLDEYDPQNPKHMVFTFDGIYENVYQYAFPILKKWDYPFELFVGGSVIGQGNEFDTAEPHARFVTMKQLQDMARHKGRILWHTKSHKSFAKAS